MKDRVRQLALLLIGVAMTGTATAGVLRDDKGDDDLEVIFAPYLWGLGIEGNAGPNGSVPVDAQFKDIISNLNMALSLHTEFHRGKWAFVIDPTYISLEPEVETPGPGNPKLDVDVWLVEAWGAYKLVPNWELLAGVRYQDQKLKFRGLPQGPGPLPLPSNLTLSENWTDLFVGTRAIYPLGEKWLVSGRADIALLGDSDTGFNAEVFFNRRIGKTMAVNLGYRYFKNNFSNGEKGLNNFTWDVRQSGPVLGYTWAF